MKHRIIDCEYLHRIEDEITDLQVKEQFRRWLNIIIKPTVLSEERSLEFLKDIYMRGCVDGWFGAIEGNDERESKWEEVKHRL